MIEYKKLKMDLEEIKITEQKHKIKKLLTQCT